MALIRSLMNNNLYHIEKKLGYWVKADLLLDKDKNEHDMEFYILFYTSYSAVIFQNF